MSDPAAIVEESARRRQTLEGPYNPYLGLGSPIERFKLAVGRNTQGQHVDLWLPRSMLEIENVRRGRERGCSIHSQVVTDNR